MLFNLVIVLAVATYFADTAMRTPLVLGLGIVLIGMVITNSMRDTWRG